MWGSQNRKDKMKRELNHIADEIEDMAALFWRADEDKKTIEQLDDWVKRIREIADKEN